MPKDRAEVQDQYKIGGGSLNEYEFDQSKGEMEESEQQSPEGAPVEGLRGADEPNAPQNVAERIHQVEERAHEIVERRRAKQAGGGAALKGGAKQAAKRSPVKAGASAKGGAKVRDGAGASKKAGASKAGKAVAKKGAAKGGAAKKSVVKGGAKKGASKKGAAGKGGAKKGGRARR
jgi:hypothetical protein